MIGGCKIKRNLCIFVKIINMKKGISLLLIITQVLFLNAQSLTVTGEASIMYNSTTSLGSDTLDPCLLTNSYLTVKNISNKEQEILCVKNVISEPSGMSNYFCWGGNCYGVSTLISGSSLILPSGQADASSFTGYFDADCNLGSATIEYCFYPIDDPDDKSCILITYHGAATEIIENESDFTMDKFYPNPAKEYTTINYKSGKNSHLKIIDILGNKVKDIHLSNVGTQDIYVGDLSKGMYFGNLVHNDKVIAVKKLIIK
jgi:hypothetical protein